MFLNYSQIKLPGPTEVEVVLLAEADDRVREIYAEKHLLELPIKYRFDEQEFSLSNLSAEEGASKGARGLRIRGEVKLSKFGPRMDPGKGAYYLYPVFRDKGGNIVWSPESLEGKSFGSSLLCQKCEAFKDQGPIEVEFFVPWYVLSLSPATGPIQYSVFASDRRRQVKFPELGKGGLVVTPPALRRYEMHLTDLIMKNSDYDTDAAPFSSNLPDLKWSFRIGNDRVYSSGKQKNSLHAQRGEARIVVAEGDTCSIVLYDIDSGFFNASDFLGKWEIPYMEMGEKYVIERRDEGLLSLLRVEMKRVR